MTSTISAIVSLWRTSTPMFEIIDNDWVSNQGRIFSTSDHPNNACLRWFMILCSYYDLVENSTDFSKLHQFQDHLVVFQNLNLQANIINEMERILMVQDLIYAPQNFLPTLLQTNLHLIQSLSKLLRSRQALSYSLIVSESIVIFGDNRTYRWSHTLHIVYSLSMYYAQECRLSFHVFTHSVNLDLRRCAGCVEYARLNIGQNEDEVLHQSSGFWCE